MTNPLRSAPPRLVGAMSRLFTLRVDPSGTGLVDATPARVGSGADQASMAWELAGEPRPM